jgi:hypothetical protein
MYDITKVQQGTARYIEAEILPKLDGKARWLVTGAATLYLSKLPALLNTPSIAATGIVSGTSIDVEALIDSVRPAARKSPAVIDIPLGGKLTFTESDLDALLNSIKQA